MILTVAIMAHPKRKAAAEALALELKSYPFTDVSIVYDRIGSEWDTGARALQRGVNRGDYHLVIQDDAILTPGFYDNVVGAIENVPVRTLISLYVGTVKPFESRVKEAVDKAYSATWLKHMLLLWGVAIAIPADHIEPMLDFVAEREEQYDTRIGIFYQRNIIPVFYTMPSLVDHNDDLGSLLDHGGAGKRRIAHKLATGPIRWNRQVIDI